MKMTQTAISDSVRIRYELMVQKYGKQTVGKRELCEILGCSLSWVNQAMNRGYGFATN